jgi:uncharacterized protein
MALLGVLLVNLDTEFRTTFFEQFQPATYPIFADKIARAALGFFVEFKAITIFSMLFGVGLAIQHDTIGSRGAVPWLLTRRLLVLLGFGLIHITLIWNGDILVEYALAGLVALPFLFGPTWLLFAAYVMAFLLFTVMPIDLPFPTAHWVTDHIVQAKLVYGTGSFSDIMRFRISEIPSLSVYLIYIFPRTLALILFGAWAWRCGFLHPQATCQPLQVIIGWTALVCGLLLSWLNGSGIPAPIVLHGDAAHVVDVIAPILLAVGYAILVLSYFHRFNAAITRGLAAVGRMAFTNYMTQSVVLGLIFYGYGGGLLGQLGVLQGIGVGLAVFAAQIWFSQWWLGTHRFGPLEWLWRSLMYGERQAMRRAG